MKSTAKNPVSPASAPLSSAAPADLRTRPLYDDVSQRARDLWESYGKPSGRDEEIWLEAERQMLGTDSGIINRDGVDVPAAAYKQAADSGATRIKTPSGDNDQAPTEFTSPASGQSTHGSRKHVG